MILYAATHLRIILLSLAKNFKSPGNTRFRTCLPEKSAADKVSQIVIPTGFTGLPRLQMQESGCKSGTEADRSNLESLLSPVNLFG
jgi:hypothetical protein